MNDLHPLDEALIECINGNANKSEEILRNQPQNDLRVLFNLGWHEMRHGNLKKGFEYLNYGRFINVFGSPHIKGKIWKDEPVKNKTVLFRCEGGYGDQILNFRFAKNFREMGANVIIACSPELKELFSIQGFICINDCAIEHIYFDYWVPSMSAPYVLNMDYDDLDGSRYINISSPIGLLNYNKKLKVGLRWSGNPKFEHEQHRKFPSELMIDLHNILNVEFYSLQRDHDCIDNIPFKDMKNDMKSWIDTANIISGLDLVITSCTSIAHLAGSMGIPTWIVIPIMPYYIWAINGETTKWYDSVRLFRQTEYGKWDDVFEYVEKELKEFSQTFKSIDI